MTYRQLHQELEVEATHIHPKWTGRINDGFDIALVKLRKAVAVDPPSLADTGYKLLPTSKLYGFKETGVVKVAVLDAAWSELCSGPESTGSETFCVRSMSTNIPTGELIASCPGNTATNITCSSVI